MKATLSISEQEILNPVTECDLLTKFLFSHKKMNLGHTKAWDIVDNQGCNSWEDEVIAIKKAYDIAIIKPVYMYNHTGITISTSPFGCIFDSGQLGYAIITKEDLRNEFNIKRITKNILAQAEAILEAEIKFYDTYLSQDSEFYLLVELDDKIIIEDVFADSESAYDKGLELLQQHTQQSKIELELIEDEHSDKVYQAQF